MQKKTPYYLESFSVQVNYGAIYKYNNKKHMQKEKIKDQRKSLIFEGLWFYCFQTYPSHIIHSVGT